MTSSSKLSPSVIGAGGVALVVLVVLVVFSYNWQRVEPVPTYWPTRAEYSEETGVLSLYLEWYSARPTDEQVKAALKPRFRQVIDGQYRDSAASADIVIKGEHYDSLMAVTITLTDIPAEPDELYLAVDATPPGIEANPILVRLRHPPNTDGYHPGGTIASTHADGLMWCRYFPKAGRLYGYGANLYQLDPQTLSPTLLWEGAGSSYSSSLREVDMADDGSLLAFTYGRIVYVMSTRTHTVGWSAETNDRLITRGMRLAADGSWVCTAAFANGHEGKENTLKRWSLPDGKEEVSFTTTRKNDRGFIIRLNRCLFSADGAFAYLHYEDQWLEKVNLADRRVVWSQVQESDSFSRVGGLRLTAGDSLLEIAINRRITYLDAATGELVKTLSLKESRHSRRVSCFPAFSPNEEHVAVAYQPGASSHPHTLFIHRTDEYTKPWKRYMHFTPERTFDADWGHSERVRPFAFIDDDHLVATVERMIITEDSEKKRVVERRTEVLLIDIRRLPNAYETW